MGAGNSLYVVRLGQQYAASDATGLTDGSGLHGQWLGAFGQDDPLVGLLGALDQLIAKHRWRQAQFAWRATAQVQPVGVEVAGNKVGDDFRTFAVIDRNFLVQLVQLVGRVIRAGTHRKDRQARQQRALAQFKNARVRLAVAGQQQARKGHTVDRCQAHGEDNVVAVARGYHQCTGLEQRHGVGHGTGTDDDFVHPSLFVVTGVEYLGAEQLGHIAGARGIEIGLVGDAAEQTEVAAAQQR
ncbi:hypothetical protein D3C78_940560 [compost metagenome]